MQSSIEYNVYGPMQVVRVEKVQRSRGMAGSAEYHPQEHLKADILYQLSRCQFQRCEQAGF